jgi:hypothetical protein
MNRRELNLTIGCLLFEYFCDLGGVLADQNDAGIRGVLDRNLVSKHPRLHLRSEQWQELRSATQTNSQLAQWYASLQQRCDELLRAPIATYQLIGPRLLSECRKALDTISCLAGVYRLDGDLRKADRARQELAAICAFPDWHPPHFLDVAEMTNAAALGYDWLFDILTVDERKLIREKIVQYGLKPGLQEYNSNAWWTQPGTNSWGQVCNGGLTVGALAVAGEAEEATDVLSRSITNIRYAMANYAPDGGWPEGPSYWHYATFYTVSMISVLESALRFDFGLPDLPGFSDTGSYRAQSIGPSGLVFNYGDANPKAGIAPETFWLARRFRKPYWTEIERQILRRDRPEIFHILWADLEESPSTATLPPLDAKFASINVAFLRSSWTDPDAIFVGAKGGNNRVSHGHLDLGSFVLDGKGQRWALDLGGDDYNLPGYFDSDGPRWQYYRLQTEAHNTLTIANENQILSASAPLIDFFSSDESGQATIDLTAAYAPRLSALRRRISLDRARKTVTVTDVIKGDVGTIVRWNLHTTAGVSARDRLAVFQQNSERISLRILKPDTVSFTTAMISPPPPQAQNEGVTTVFVDVALSNEELHLSMVYDLS